MKNNSMLLFLEFIQDIRKYDISQFIGWNPNQVNTFWKTHNINLNINAIDKAVYEKKLILILKKLQINNYIIDALDIENWQNLWTGICITKNWLDLLEKEKKNRLWVKYKNPNWNYEKESKIPTIIKSYKFKKKDHRKLFLKNLICNIKESLKKNKFADFFNRYSWLWWFIAIIVMLILGIFFSNSWYIQNNNIDNSQSINISWNSWQVAIWDNNKLIQNKIPTSTEENEYNQWAECETTFRAFIRRLNRDDFDYAYSLFDKYLSKVKYFSVENLKEFKLSFVKTDLEIWEISKKFIDNSKFVSRCEFGFKLRYINKKDWKDRIEMWKWVVLKNKDEVDYFQIWELKCLDKKCENNPLFD